MRIFYVFNIKKDLVKLTKDEPEKLFLALEKLNNMGEDMVESAYKKITQDFNVDHLNILIREIYSDNLNYSCYKNVHSYNDYFKNENTKLFMNKPYLKIKSNMNFPMFLNDIKNKDDLFICDFVNMDYFYLRDIEGILV